MEGFAPDELLRLIGEGGIWSLGWILFVALYLDERRRMIGDAKAREARAEREQAAIDAQRALARALERIDQTLAETVRVLLIEQSARELREREHARARDMHELLGAAERRGRRGVGGE